jgi:hypothetical protein
VAQGAEFVCLKNTNLPDRLVVTSLTPAETVNF